MHAALKIQIAAKSKTWLNTVSLTSSLHLAGLNEFIRLLKGQIQLLQLPLPKSGPGTNPAKYLRLLNCPACSCLQPMRQFGKGRYPSQCSYNHPQL